MSPFYDRLPSVPGFGVEVSAALLEVLHLAAVDPAFVSDSNHTTGLLRIAHLVVEPLRDVVEGGLQPVVHVLHLSEC